MTTVAEETTRAQSYLAGRLEEQSKVLQELKAGQQQIIEMIDRTNARTNERIDQTNARIDRTNEQTNERIDQANARTNERIDQTNERLDRLNARIDRMLLTGWIVGGAVITAQMGMLGTLIVLTIRMGSGS